MRTERIFALALGAAVVVAGGIALVGGGSSAGAGADDEVTTTVLMPGYHRTDEPTDGPLADAVSRALGGRAVIGAHTTESDRGSSTEIDLQGRYDVEISGQSNAADLTDQPRVEAEGGRAWIGSDQDFLHSVYFVADNGVALRIASYAVGGEPADSIAELTAVAQRLSVDDAVMQAAGR